MAIHALIPALPPAVAFARARARARARAVAVAVAVALALALALALAAVISPTDPIAVSDIAGRTPVPTRMQPVLEGEALFNDASDLVCMRLAVAAALTGSVALSAALLSFLWVVLGGLAIGAGVTWLATLLAI